MFALLDFYVEYFSTEEFQRRTTGLKTEAKGGKKLLLFFFIPFFMSDMLMKYLYSFPKGFILLSVPDFLFRMIQQ